MNDLFNAKPETSKKIVIFERNLDEVKMAKRQ